MPAERYYIDDDFISKTVIVGGQEFSHLSHMMRSKPSHPIELVNGRGKLAKATLKSMGKSEVELNILEVHQDTKKHPKIILAQALPKQNHLDWIIEKGTELGASEFWLFTGDFSEKQDFREDRLKNLAIAAMKQCGRLDLPPIVQKPPLSQWKPLPGTSFFGDTNPTSPLLSKPSAEPITFFVGPEKGFSPSEIEILVKSLYAKGVKLHDNILRTETAGIVALSLLHYLVR